MIDATPFLRLDGFPDPDWQPGDPLSPPYCGLGARRKLVELVDDYRDGEPDEYGADAYARRFDGTANPCLWARWEAAGAMYWSPDPTLGPWSWLVAR